MLERRLEPSKTLGAPEALELLSTGAATGSRVLKGAAKGSNAAVPGSNGAAPCSNPAFSVHWSLLCAWPERRRPVGKNITCKVMMCVK